MDEAVSTFLASYPELEYREERGGIVSVSFYHSIYVVGVDSFCNDELLRSGPLFTEWP